MQSNSHKQRLPVRCSPWTMMIETKTNFQLSHPERGRQNRTRKKQGGEENASKQYCPVRGRSIVAWESFCVVNQGKHFVSFRSSIRDTSMQQCAHTDLDTCWKTLPSVHPSCTTKKPDGRALLAYCFCCYPNNASLSFFAMDSCRSSYFQAQTSTLSLSFIISLTIYS